jgi:hypothetical protein
MRINFTKARAGYISSGSARKESRVSRLDFHSNSFFREPSSPGREEPGESRDKDHRARQKDISHGLTLVTSWRKKTKKNERRKKKKGILEGRRRGVEKIE